MHKREVLVILANHQNTLKTFGVKSLVLFGSVARDEAGTDSDVDLLVEFDRPNEITFDEFQDDRKTIRAVLYNLAIIGEAVHVIAPELKSAYPQIPWDDVRGMRNIVIHEYFQVNLAIIWQTIQEDLVSLSCYTFKRLILKPRPLASRLLY